MPGRGGRTKGTLFELASNGLTTRQGIAWMDGIGAALEKICRSCHQLRTSLTQPIRGLAVAVGIGTEFGSSF